jgi:hypothetical protein
MVWRSKKKRMQHSSASTVHPPRMQKKRAWNLHQAPNERTAYLFLDCLYVKRLRVLNAKERSQSTLFIFHPAMLRQSPRRALNENGVYIRNIFPKLATDHLLRHLDLNVCLAIVHGEPQTDEVREDGCCAFRGADWGCVRGRGESARESDTVEDYWVSFWFWDWIFCSPWYDPMLGKGSFALGVDWRSRTGRCLGLVALLAGCFF